MSPPSSDRRLRPWPTRYAASKALQRQSAEFGRRRESGIALARVRHHPSQLAVAFVKEQVLHVAHRDAARQRLAQLDVDAQRVFERQERDRKSTRLNSSHLVISYAV